MRPDWKPNAETSVNAYRIPTDTHEFLTPDGLLARRSIVAPPFRKAFTGDVGAEPRNKRWYHPKMWGCFRQSTIPA
nr:hypothetical protein [Salmonella sp.]